MDDWRVELAVYLVAATILSVLIVVLAVKIGGP